MKTLIRTLVLSLALSSAALAQNISSDNTESKTITKQICGTGWTVSQAILDHDLKFQNALRIPGYSKSFTQAEALPEYRGLYSFCNWMRFTPK